MISASNLLFPNDPIIPEDRVHQLGDVQSAPIRHVLHDPTTPELIKEVPLPPTPECPNFVVVGYQGGGYEPYTPQGQAASVMVTINDSLKSVNNHTEKKMKSWSSTEKLIIIPRAGKMFNAYYDRRTLSFFFDHNKKKEEIFTSNSSEVVAHELGHAILDFYRPDLWNLGYIEVWAFHEAFGDINAFFASLQHDEIIHYMLKQTNNNLRISNVASKLAEQFGQAIFDIEGASQNPHCLRDMSNDSNYFKYVNPSNLPSDTPDNVLSSEPHNFSRVFSGVIYDIFVMMYQDNLNNGISPVEAVKQARETLQGYVMKAIQNVPAVPSFYEAMAKTILWCDWSLPHRPFHDRMWEIFLKRNMIKPLSIMWHNEFVPEVKPLTTVKLCHHVKGHRALYRNPLYYVDVEVADHDDESIEAAHHMITFLHQHDKIGPGVDTPFEISEGKLVRSHFACGGGCVGNPSKHQPEYYKPYKPQNNNGCGCGYHRQDVDIVARPTIKKGCFIRYRVKK